MKKTMSGILIIIFPLFVAATYIALFDNPDARTYWPFMISSYVVALLAYFYIFQGKEHIKQDKPLEFLFSPKLWLHQSAKIDYWIITINYFIASYILEFIIAAPNWYVEAAGSFFSSLNIIQRPETPSVTVTLVFFFLVFLASDFMYFVAHMLMHRFPSLWEFHKVHHSAEVMTPLTVLRAHPIELWLLHSFRSFGQGFVSAVFLYIYPNLQTFAIVISINWIVLFINATFANLRHSHVWISYGSVIEKIFLSPAQHQIHHSTKRKHFDRNFGSTLAIWDWLFNSLYITTKNEEVVFGLGKEKETAKLDTVWDYYWTPFVRFFNIIFRK